MEQAGELELLMEKFQGRSCAACKAVSRGGGGAWRVWEPSGNFEKKRAGEAATTPPWNRALVGVTELRSPGPGEFLELGSASQGSF